jgi:hypothetical protein
LALPFLKIFIFIENGAGIIKTIVFLGKLILKFRNSSSNQTEPFPEPIE